MGTDYFGKQIPFLDLVGVRVELSEKGHALVSVDLRPELTNSLEVAHGGVIMTLLDVAMATAAAASGGLKSGSMTIDMSLSFLRPAKGRVTAEGRVLRGGRSLIFCEAEARDISGELVAKSLGTFKLHHRMRDGEGN